MNVFFIVGVEWNYYYVEVGMFILFDEETFVVCGLDGVCNSFRKRGV